MWLGQTCGFITNSGYFGIHTTQTPDWHRKVSDIFVGQEGKYNKNVILSSECVSRLLALSAELSEF